MSRSSSRRVNIVELLTTTNFFCDLAVPTRSEWCIDRPVGEGRSVGCPPRGPWFAVGRELVHSSTLRPSFWPERSCPGVELVTMTGYRVEVPDEVAGDIRIVCEDHGASERFPPRYQKVGFFCGGCGVEIVVHLRNTDDRRDMSEM